MKRIIKVTSPLAPYSSCIVNPGAIKCLLCSVDEIESLKAQLGEYSELKNATQAIVEMVDPLEEGTPSTRTLVESLQEAPQKIVGYLSDNAKLYVVHVLGLVKSYWPQANLAPLEKGIPSECSEEKFCAF